MISEMIRESYGSSSSATTVDLTNYVTKSELNSSVVKVIKNLDSDNYKESEGLITTIHDETITNLTTGYNNTQFTNMTNLNDWVDDKITNGSNGLYNKIKSELFLKEMNHKPINNINFNYQVKKSEGVYENWSFNTNNLVFKEIKTITNADYINVSLGDVIIVFFKTSYNNNYVVDCMLIMFYGLYSSTTRSISHLVYGDDTVEYTYFKAQPFFDYYDDKNPVYKSSGVTISCNAECMLTTKFTDTVQCPYVDNNVNYYYFWSGGNDNYIDFTNVFMTNNTNQLIFLDKAFTGSVNTDLNLTDQSFYALRQRNSIQNEILNMFSDTNILNDLKMMLNLYQVYSISSIFTSNQQQNYILKQLSSIDNQNSTYSVTEASVYVAFFNDTKRNIVGMDLVYCPSGKKIGLATTSSNGIENDNIYYKCNNIFYSSNDLMIQCEGCVNLNRNISFTINFMNIRSSESSTHLLITSQKCSFNHMFYNLFNNTNQYIMMVKFSSLYTSSMSKGSVLLDLDDWIDSKQGCIMNTECSDSIRITF